MRILRILLPLLALLLGSVAAKAQDGTEVHTLTTRCIPADAVSGYPKSAEYSAGESVRLSISGKTGFRFVRWEDEEGAEVSANSTFTYEMPDRDVTLTARFVFEPSSPDEPATPKETGTVYLQVSPSDAGSINRTSGEKFEAGQTVNLYTMAYGTYSFVNWTRDGEEISTNASFNYTVLPGDQTLTANYVFNPTSPDEPSAPTLAHLLKLVTNPEGATTYLTGAGRYDTGATINVYGSVKDYYTFINWTDDLGDVVSETFDFRYTMPDRDVTLTANFSFEFNPTSPDEPSAPTLAHSLKLVTNPEGATTYLTGAGRYDTGATINVYGSVKDYYTFINWTDDLGDVVSETFDFRYTMPDRDVTLTGNFSFEFNPESPSEPSSSDIPDRLYVAKPRISLYDDEHVMILCETYGAEIHYTLDGTKPSKNSPVYEDLIELPGNLTVKAIAFKEGLIDSAVDELEVTHFVLAVPTAEYINRHLYLTCLTPGAQMRYTLDGSVPSSASTLYESPIPLTGDCTVRFLAQKDKYVDSEEGSFDFVYADYMTKGVSSSYSKHYLTLACEDPAARIHYCFDDEPLTEECAVYDSPLPMTRSCVVKFMGVGTGLYPSDAASYEFNLDAWQETAPSLDTDYSTRRITVSHPGNLPVRVTLDGNEETQQTPHTLYVAPGMSTLSVATIATTEDRYDSDAVDTSLVFHAAPVHSAYDGHSVGWSLGDGEPRPEEAGLWAYFNGDAVAEGGTSRTVDVTDFGRMSACVKSDGAFRSDTTYIDIDHYNTGRVAGVRNGHRLEEAFLTWGDAKEDYTYLRLRGSIEAADLRFAAGLPALTALHLDGGTLGESGYDGALSGSAVETLFSCSYPEGLLSGMPRLTSAMWGRTDSAVPDRLAVESGNPNLLLWVPEGSPLPEGAANLVTYRLEAGDEPADPAGNGSAGEAALLTLKAGHPFGVHRALRAGRVEVSKEFLQQTVPDVCRGWETVVLPFTPDSVVHEREGRITPFAACEGDIRTLRPFWLYSPTAEGWKAEGAVEALRPYIIQMPNNPDYVDAYNLNGTVTFVADGVEMRPGGLDPVSAEWTGGRYLEGTFMPVGEEGLLSLNVNGEDGLLPGSHFTAGSATLPFGAYVRNAGSARSIPVFGGSNGAEMPTSGEAGLVVEAPAPGTLRISSGRERSVAVTAATGVTMRTLSLRPGETVTIEGLTRGLYIVGGVKVMVR